MHQLDCSAYGSELGDGPAKPHRIYGERALLACLRVAFALMHEVKERCNWVNELSIC